MRAIVIRAARACGSKTAPTRRLAPARCACGRLPAGFADLHYCNHGRFGTVRLKEPMILGHEVLARVETLGPGVTGFSVGQLVAVSPSRPCGGCKFCLGGWANQCLNMRFYGSAMPFAHIQGVRSRIIWNSRADFGAEVIGLSGQVCAACR
jgi:L-idonate 5-dehydrogenase